MWGLKIPSPSVKHPELGKKTFSLTRSEVCRTLIIGYLGKVGILITKQLERFEFRIDFCPKFHTSEAFCVRNIEASKTFQRLYFYYNFFSRLVSSSTSANLLISSFDCVIYFCTKLIASWKG